MPPPTRVRPGKSREPRRREDEELEVCPGCGHTVVVKALNAALVKLQLDPKKVVIVTDIGCIGLADRNFTTSAFHGLHGRSITYACGLKLARPELFVIAIKGDGACGIGGTHLLNVARRNIGITLLVHHARKSPAATQAIHIARPRPMHSFRTALSAQGSGLNNRTAYGKNPKN